MDWIETVLQKVDAQHALKSDQHSFKFVYSPLVPSLYDYVQ